MTEKPPVQSVLSVLVPNQKTSGYPKKKIKLNTGPLEALLLGEYTHDAHFVQYGVCDSAGPYRYNGDVFGALEKDSIEMVAVAIDVDSPAKKSTVLGAVDEWWDGERPKVQRLLVDHPGFAYRTQGGYRVVWTLAQSVALSNSDDAGTWRKNYLAFLAYLERVFGIVSDPACNDWNRLFRVPFGRRDGEQKTVRRETIGALAPFDAFACITEADRQAARKSNAKTFDKVSKAKRKDAAADTFTGPSIVGNGVWFEWLNHRGMIGRELGPGKWAITCPNEAAHTSHSDTGTVLYAPEGGSVYGSIHCSHAHCQGVDFRTFVDPNVWQRIKDAQRAEEPVPVAAEVDPTESVMQRLSVDPKDSTKYTADASNVGLLLAHHPYWKGALAFDAFRGDRLWLRLPEAVAGNHTAAHGNGMGFVDADCVAIQRWLKTGDIKIFAGIETIRTACMEAATVNQIDSYAEHIRQYKGQWDGKARLDTHVIDFFGAKDTPLNRAISARFYIGAVARSQRPGCVADFMLILEGPQEAGKNYYLQIMFGESYVVTPDPSAKFGSKEFDQKVADAGCIHDDELACLRHSILDQVKGWLTATRSKFRKAYDREFHEYLRRFVVAGSTNCADYLVDDENRRFWPLAVSKLKAEELKAVRVQLWAEAYVRWELGEEYRITKADPLWKALADEHADRRNENPLVGLIREMLRVSPKALPGNGFEASQVMSALGWSIEKIDDIRAKRLVASALAELGYARKRVRLDDETRPYHWFRELRPRGQTMTDEEIEREAIQNE